jgi:hypothetical protein
MKSIYASLVALILLSACSSKQYFEPEKSYSASFASEHYSDTIIDLSRNGATLESGYYIGKNGIKYVPLEKGYRFVNETPQYALASNPEGKLKIIDKKSKKSIRTLHLDQPIVSVTMRGDIIAYILNNNTYGLYSMKRDAKLVENRSEQIYAIDTRSATPLFVENLVVMPMLDGKVVIVSIANPDNAKVIYISNDTAFNNVIHLSRLQNTMIAATPKRIITIGGTGKRDYSTTISEVVVASNRIYLFNKDGSILALNSQLEVLHKKAFKFAHYAVATAIGDRIYALDQQGALIILNSTLSKQKIYDLGAIKQPAFIAGSLLYKDGDQIDLARLGYE